MHAMEAVAAPHRTWMIGDQSEWDIARRSAWQSMRSGWIVHGDG